MALCVGLGSSSAHAQVTTYTDAAQFVAALASPTVVDFDELTAPTVLTGDEYAGRGLVIRHLDGASLNVFTPDPECPGLRHSPANALGSSYGGLAGPDFRGTNCPDVFFADSHSDHIAFEFPDGASAAGIFFIENDVAGVSVSFLDQQGATIYSQQFPAFAPHGGYLGIVSDTPIASMVVFNGAGDGDGMAFDDVIFQSIAPSGRCEQIHKTAEQTCKNLANKEDRHVCSKQANDAKHECKAARKTCEKNADLARKACDGLPEAERQACRQAAEAKKHACRG